MGVSPFDRVPRGALWEVLREYGVPDPLIGALYDRCQSLVRIAGCKSDAFPVRVGLHQGCPLSPILFIILMDRVPTLFGVPGGGTGECSCRRLPRSDGGLQCSRGQ